MMTQMQPLVRLKKGILSTVLFGLDGGDDAHSDTKKKARKEIYLRLQLAPLRRRTRRGNDDLRYDLLLALPPLQTWRLIPRFFQAVAHV
eukprot:766518-Hanusia_phi.AAC.12